MAEKSGRMVDLEGLQFFEGRAEKPVMAVVGFKPTGESTSCFDGTGVTAARRIRARLAFKSFSRRARQGAGVGAELDV